MSPKILSGTATGNAHPKTHSNHTFCRCDGIGRRSGLKIHRWRQRTGSSPVTGTKKERGFRLSLFWCRRPGRLDAGESLATSPSAAGDGYSEGVVCAAVGVQRRHSRQGARRVLQTETGTKAYSTHPSGVLYFYRGSQMSINTLKAKRNDP